jgi:hypothetical protein
LHRDADFLEQLASQPEQGRLAHFEFPTWKLPTSRKLLALRPLRDQHSIEAIDERAGDDVNGRKIVIFGVQPLACCSVP